MGIRFYCPNGHKLNVKSFQAGRAGICPRCGARLQIPIESTRESSKHGNVVTTTDQVEAVGDGGAAAAANTPRLPDGDGKPSTAKPVVTDPLTAAPDAVWYVRPSGGGQFGPASGEVIRGWLGQQRVQADSLVWREGWRDWLEAAEVFPQLASEDVVAELSQIAASASAETADAGRYIAAQQRRTQPNSTTLVIVLFVAVVLLLSVLIWVF